MRNALCLLAGAGLTLASAAYSVAQPSGEGTTFIRNTAEAVAASPFDTRQGRLAAKPLDWNVTKGKAVKPAPGQAEPEAARPRAPKPGSSPGGAPSPKANEDAEKGIPANGRGCASSRTASRRPTRPTSAWISALRTSSVPES